MNDSTKLYKSDYSTQLDLLGLAQRIIIVSLPNITLELAHALVSYSSKGIKVSVFMEINERSYRNGFGDFEALRILTIKNIPVFNKEKFNIYCFIIDNEGYFYFPKSSFHEEEGLAYDLYPMSTNQIKHIKFLFNLNETDKDMEDVFETSDNEQVKEITNNISKPVHEKTEALLSKLEKDPPLKPNFARTLDVYKAKFQYVDLTFKGANLHITKVKIPSKALPFKDENLKKSIEATLRLFTNIPEKEYLKDFFSLKEKEEELRAKFLVFIKSRSKSIISRDQKSTFEASIKDLREEIKKNKTKVINDLQKDIINSRKQIEENLINFLLVNPPDDLMHYNPENRKEEIIRIAHKIVSNIPFPQAKKLLDGLKIDYHYYDLTWEDLNNSEVTNELVDKQLLSKKEKAYIESQAIEANEVI
jgi:hypothetical protein